MNPDKYPVSNDLVTLSETGCVHRRFISIVEMTPEESQNAEIHLSFQEGPFGKMLIASTTKGICNLSLAKDETLAMASLKRKFPKATFREKEEASHLNAISIIKTGQEPKEEIRLQLKGTDFQLQVWKALLAIPMGKLVSYGYIAGQIGRPKAFRAVGTAVGDNPVFFLVPCHRVIQSGGNMGNYYWGPEIKKALIEWESSLQHQR